MRKFCASVVFQFPCFCLLTRIGYLESNSKELLTMQGVGFKLSTKVFFVGTEDEKLVITTRAAKDGKQEKVRGLQISLFPAEAELGLQSSRAILCSSPSAVGNISKASISKTLVSEVNSGGRIVIGGQFSMSVPSIDDNTFVPSDARSQGSGGGHRGGGVHALGTRQSGL